MFSKWKVMRKKLLLFRGYVSEETVVLLGEFSRVIMCYQQSSLRKLAVKSYKADVSSVSPSSERMEELRAVCVFTCGKWSYAISGDVKGKCLFYSFAASRTA